MRTLENVFQPQINGWPRDGPTTDCGETPQLHYKMLNHVPFSSIPLPSAKMKTALITLMAHLLVLYSMGLNLHAAEKPMPKDLITPEMTLDEPAAGRRVRQVATEYEGTEVYHALYLPTNWRPDGNYSVIVEYTGNRSPGCGSTGKVKDANFGYGLSGGKDFIWVSMPYIKKGGKTNSLTWWGDKQATIDYCKTNLPRICHQFGGDPENVFICGFSRGAIATSYIGLADDEIAALWKGLITHDHFDGDRKWGYPAGDRESALARLARLKDRPVLACGIGTDFLSDHPGLAEITFLKPPVGEIFKIPEGKVIALHTDLWMHRESTYRQSARRWLQKHQSVQENKKPLQK
jgi:hypothetical protein